jgi:hypothetical protein
MTRKYDLSGGRFVQFEFEKKAARVTMRKGPGGRIKAPYE